MGFNRIILDIPFLKALYKASGEEGVDKMLARADAIQYLDEDSVKFITLWREEKREEAVSILSKE